MSICRYPRLASVVSGFCVVALLSASGSPAVSGEKQFRAGAAEVNISPEKFPVIISGGFLQGRGDQLTDPLFSRALVLDDGATRLAIVVVDTLMMPRELVDDAKKSIEQRTGIPSDRIVVAATHTHTAPSVMGALGTGVDRGYADRLPGWIVESVVAAVQNIAPARIGWTVAVDSQHTNCRRWIYRPDRIATDPFGDQSIRAMMHPGYQNPDFIGPAGPEDPGLSVLAVQSRDGRPLAVLANYSMHYFGAAPVSADYFGRFCQHMKQLVNKDGTDHPCVAMMSQGTAGDLHWMDYSQPATNIALETYSNEVAEVAFRAYQQIEYRDWVPLAMAEQKLTLGRRVPDEKRLAWAQQIVAEMHGRTLAESQREVYALEQIYLSQRAAAGTRAASGARRRSGNYGDACRGLWHHRRENQGSQPAAADVQHGIGQRSRWLHPAAGATQTWRVHDLAGSHGRLGSGRGAEDRRSGPTTSGTGRRSAAAHAPGCRRRVRSGGPRLEARGLLATARHGRATSGGCVWR